MQQKLYWLVSSPIWREIPDPPKYVTMFTFEGEGDGVFTAYHAGESEEKYWNLWLKRKDRDPSNLLDSMPMCMAKTGYVKGEEHFQQLLREIGIVTERDTLKGKSKSWVDMSTKDFLSNAPSMEFKEGGYTMPELRNRIKNRIMAGSSGGAPGQWSARKAQMVAVAYRKAGGGYTGKPRKTQRSLKKWTREKWTTSDGKPAIRKGGTRRYLPASAWSRLTPAQRAATNRKKVSGSRKGNQFVENTRSAADASRKARD
jgi:hypothetical protein